MSNISDWEKRGREMGAQYLISVCDRFSYEDYPVFVMANDILEEERKKYDGPNMQSINEIITL
jgi:hypothetical protein